MIFYVIYYFCCQWKEKIYIQVYVEPDGVEFLYQFMDEIGKNHGPDDQSKTKATMVNMNKLNTTLRLPK